MDHEKTFARLYIVCFRDLNEYLSEEEEGSGAEEGWHVTEAGARAVEEGGHTREKGARQRARERRTRGKGGGRGGRVVKGQ
jgi:hypothetical protein